MRTLILPLALVAASCAPDDTPTVTHDVEEAVNAPTMSAAEFAALETGMSYEQAVEIIGGEGEVISESEIADIRTVMYQWEGEGSFGANANAMFQNGELVNKAQFGLE